MKSFVISLCLFFATLAVSLYLSLTVRHRANEILEMIDSLPERSTDDGVAEKLDEIEKMWYSHDFIFTLCLSHTVNAQTELCISDLKTKINTDQNSDYTEKKGALRTAIRSIIKNQSLGIDGVV